MIGLKTHNTFKNKFCQVLNGYSIQLIIFTAQLALIILKATLITKLALNPTIMKVLIENFG